MKWIEEFKGLVWTLAGTGLVLITLSGETRALALWISGIALVSNLLAILFSSDESE